MSDYLLYLIKTLIGLGAFALIYRLIYSNEVYFISRRAYLLISVILSLLLPIGSSSLELFSLNLNSGTNAFILDEITVYSNGIKSIESNSSIPIKMISLWTYFTVSGFFIIRLIVHLVRIISLSSKYSYSKYNDLKVYRIPLKNTSFSFFRKIFIGNTPEKDDFEKIIEHEKIHAMQWHTFDVLSMEILCSLFWLNPMLWWYKKEIKNVHEYLADDGALQKGFNTKAYQITILEHLIGSASLTITNNFNYSLIKNRIAMMNLEKSGRKNRWKIFLLLPISIALVLVFACTEKSTDSAHSPDMETLYLEADEMPVFSDNQDFVSGIRTYITQNIRYPQAAAENGIQGKVLLQFIINKDGNVVVSDKNFQLSEEDMKKSADQNADYKSVVVVGYKPAKTSKADDSGEFIQLLKDEAVRVISSLPKCKKPALKDGKAVAVMYTFPINFVLQ